MRERIAKAVKSRNGFTLIEMVVVLVIIAVLASMMLGALNGYIDKAKEKQVLADCRNVVIAGNTVGAETYAGGSVYRPRTQVQELSGVELNQDLGADEGCIVEYGSDCTVIGVVCWSGDITAQYLAPNTAYNPTGTAKLEIIDKSEICISDNWGALDAYGQNIDVVDEEQDFTFD